MFTIVFVIIYAYVKIKHTRIKRRNRCDSSGMSIKHASL